MTSNMPEWLRQVPLKTVGVLCATHIFGKNIESRHIVLAGKRYFHNAVENVVGYVLNPILPKLDGDTLDNPEPHAAAALANVRDCFNFIFHIQVEYFKTLSRLFPDRFRSKKTGAEFNLNQFMAKGPTLINSEKRYLILSRVDGAQPFDLDLDWGADFNWIDDDIRRLFRSRLRLAQDVYAETLTLGKWYAGRDRNLIIPLKTIMDDLSEYFEHLGLAAYAMAKNGRHPSDENLAAIRENLVATCRHLERFTMDLLRLGVFSIIKHDLDRLGEQNIGRVIRVRAEDESYAVRSGFDTRYIEYEDTLHGLYEAIGYKALVQS